METYMVSGCGISAVCESKAAVEYWINEIIMRGGCPTITRLSTNIEAAA